jgi:hypothetical protein
MNSETTSTGKLKPHKDDIESPDAIIRAMYQIISGPAGKRNWARLRTLYLEGARLIPIGKRANGEQGPKVMTVDEWIENARPFLAENDFYESEIQRHSDRFGNMIQAFSTYETREKPDGPATARGINSFQLIEHDDRWWIVSVLWDNESKNNPIPVEFTPYLW